MPNGNSPPAPPLNSKLTLLATLLTVAVALVTLANYLTSILSSKQELETLRVSLTQQIVTVHEQVVRQDSTDERLWIDLNEEIDRVESRLSSEMNQIERESDESTRELYMLMLRHLERHEGVKP